MEPEASPHRPSESNGEQRQKLTELVRVTEVSRFWVKASGLEGCKESLETPATSVIVQRRFRSRVRDQDEQLAIRET